MHPNNTTPQPPGPSSTSPRRATIGSHTHGAHDTGGLHLFHQRHQILVPVTANPTAAPWSAALRRGQRPTEANGAASSKKSVDLPSEKQRLRPSDGRSSIPEKGSSNKPLNPRAAAEKETTSKPHPILGVEGGLAHLRELLLLGVPEAPDASIAGAPDEATTVGHEDGGQRHTGLTAKPRRFWLEACARRM